MYRVRSLSRIGLIGLLAGSASGSIVPFDTDVSGEYLVIARMELNGNTDVSTSNFELGANKAPVPSTNTSFLDGGSSGGPTLLEGNVPTLPTRTSSRSSRASAGTATSPSPTRAGEFEPPGRGRLRGPGRSASASPAMSQSSTTSRPTPSSTIRIMFPNTFDINTQTGVDGQPGNDAVQSTRIDRSTATPGSTPA